MSMLTDILFSDSPTPAVRAALQKCPHCPFLAKWSECAEGIDRDAEFTLADVDRWIESAPWPCHKYPDASKPCCGQAMFKAGLLGTTREELARVWVEGEGCA